MPLHPVGRYNVVITGTEPYRTASGKDLIRCKFISKHGNHILYQSFGDAIVIGDCVYIEVTHHQHNDRTLMHVKYMWKETRSLKRKRDHE